jgi:hypothetical protein
VRVGLSPSPSRCISHRRRRRSSATRRSLRWRLPERSRDRSVSTREVVALEERRVRQNHVGVARRVGHHLVEHDREQIVALAAFAARALIRRRDRGVRVVDEQRLDRRIVYS